MRLQARVIRLPKRGQSEENDRFGDTDDPQRLLRDALRPRFRMDSHLPSDYEFEERKRNKMDDECVILSSGNLCGYNFSFFPACKAGVSSPKGTLGPF